MSIRDKRRKRKEKSYRPSKNDFLPESIFVQKLRPSVASLRQKRVARKESFRQKVNRVKLTFEIPNRSLKWPLRSFNEIGSHLKLLLLNDPLQCLTSFKLNHGDHFLTRDELLLPAHTQGQLRNIRECAKKSCVCSRTS